MSILCVFAHPDDEFFVAGLLLRAKKMSVPTHLICLTQGESGAIYGDRNIKKSIKKRIRAAELHQSAINLKLSSYNHYNFQDGNSSNWDLMQIENILSDAINTLKPKIIITFDESGGINSHRDHIKINQIISHFKENTSIIDNIEIFYSTLYSTTVINRYFNEMNLTSDTLEIITSPFEIDPSVLCLTTEEQVVKNNLLTIYKSQFPDIHKKYYYLNKSVITHISKVECYTPNTLNQCTNINEIFPCILQT